MDPKSHVTPVPTSHQQGHLLPLQVQAATQIAHDFKQSMQALRLSLTDLHALLTRDSVAGRKYVEQVELVMSAHVECAMFMDDLLDALSGRVQRVPRAEAVYLNEMFRGMATKFGPSARAAGIHLQIAPTRRVCVTDPYLLGRIISNLVANAIAHSQATRVLIGVRSSQEGLRIMICDDGIGLVQKAPFDGAALSDVVMDSHRDGSSPGHGLGLWIAHQLTRSLGGVIRICTSAGEGSVIQIHLPAALAA